MDLQEREFLEAIGRRIRALREEMGLTEAELGERAGLHRTFVGSAERGERNLSLLNLRKIALALRVTPAALLADQGGEGQARTEPAT